MTKIIPFPLKKTEQEVIYLEVFPEHQQPRIVMKCLNGEELKALWKKPASYEITQAKPWFHRVPI